MSSASTLTRFGANTLVGELVAIGIVRELGPVIAGLVVAGRNAAGMASEFGSMIVTEQIDAIRALGRDVTPLETPFGWTRGRRGRLSPHGLRLS